MTSQLFFVIFLLINSVLSHGVHYDESATIEAGPASLNTWISALGSTFLISIIPFALLFVIGISELPEKKNYLNRWLAFTSGSLLGDTFLHILPEVNEQISRLKHDKHKIGYFGNDIQVGIFIILGILSFLIMEKSVRCCRKCNFMPEFINRLLCNSSSNNDMNQQNENDKEKLLLKKKDNDKVTGVEQNKNNAFAVSAYLNLVADVFHNFTDGLGIGASYLSGHEMGLITFVAILIHEIPHEIGDCAVLIKSGCPKSKAIAFQLVTALGAFLGTILALLGHSVFQNVTLLILPFTAGGFIYVSLVTIIPNLSNPGDSLKETVIRMVLIASGVFFMLLMSLNVENTIKDIYKKIEL